MNTEGITRKLIAILSADVKDYTRLMSQDDVGTIRTLSAYKEAMEILIRRYRGTLVDTTGDSFLARFESVLDAVNAAAEIQRDLAERNAELPDHRRMEFRMGINLGDVVEAKRRDPPTTRQRVSSLLVPTRFVYKPHLSESRRIADTCVRIAS